MNRSRLFAPSALTLTALVVACGHGGGADRSGSEATAASSASASAAQASASAAPAGLVDGGAPQQLVVAAAKPLVGLPDAFEPSGALVGQHRGDQCDVWDVGVGAYRGAFPRSVCDDWATQLGRAAGRKLRRDGAAIVVEREVPGGAAQPIARLEGCWDPPIASAISHDGERVAAVCGEHVWVWPAKGGRAEDLGDLASDLRRATVAFDADDRVVALAERMKDQNDFCDGKTTFMDCDRFQFVQFELGPKRERSEEDVGIARLDPYGHVLFRAGGFCGRDCIEDVRVQALGGRTTPLEWRVTPAPKPSPTTAPAHRFSDDGTACLVRQYFATPEGPLAATSFALVAKDGANPATVDGVRPAVAPNGRRAASIRLPAFDGEMGAVEIASLGGEGDPPTQKSIPLSDSAATQLAFSPDAAWLAVQFPKRAVVYDAATGRAALFWDDVTAVAFDHARPGVIYGQKGDVVVRRAIAIAVGGAAAGAVDAPFEVHGKMLRGSFGRRQGLFVSQNGMTVAYDGGGTELGRWPVVGDEVLFGEGGTTVIVGAHDASVVALGKSGSIQWTAEVPKGARVLTVGREIWIGASRHDAATGAVTGPVTLERGAEPSPDGTWSCGDAVVRKDGARLQVVQGSVVSESGAHQGPAHGADAFALRVEGDPLQAPLIRAGMLPERPGLVRDFFVGAAIPAPVLAGAIPVLHRYSIRLLPSDAGTFRTELKIAAAGTVHVYGPRADLVTTLPAADPVQVRSLILPGASGFTVEVCEGSLCTPRAVASAVDP